MNDFARLDSQKLERLKGLLGGGSLKTDPGAFEKYGRDETENLYFAPEAVAIPSSTEEVSKLLAFAQEHRIPVTARGGGTGLSGGALPVRGGVVLSLEKFNRIRTLDTRNLTMEAEAGVTTREIHDRAEGAGLFYPPDPASRDSCFIGGNIAEDSAGPRSCKYGPTRNYVMALEAVLPGGEIIRTGGATRKDVTGYNLTQLLVGSEGTLAVVTAATLRLLPLPKERLTIALPFGSLDRAAAAVEELFKQPWTPCACEILERRALEAVETVHPVPPQLAGKDALLVLELDGDDAEELLEQAVHFCGVAEKAGAGEAIVARQASDQRTLWDVRRKVGEAVKHRSIYKEADAVVPRHRLAELVRAARRCTQEYGLDAICYGHAADGNLHVNILRGDLTEAEWQKRRDAAERRLFEEVMALGGRLSGEHGIGYVQKKLLPLAVDPATLALMRRVKAAFDPHGILNPGKIFPD